jgi:putative DNA primase/helicase
MTGSTLERARGRWPEILPRLGIGTEFLRNKHGPCPICGGRDRYRFDDRDGEGTYYCNQCGAGSGIILVRKLNGWDFKTACDAIDAIIGTEHRAEPAPQKPADDPERRRRAIEKAIAGANDQSIVEHYLAGRGLGVVPESLYGHPALWHSEARKSLPAVLAPIFGPGGDLESVQRIWIGADVPPDARKTIMPPVRTISGGAVRLFNAAPEMGIGEGVETSLAAAQLWALPVWAALTAGNLEAWQPPADVQTVHVFGDNDSSMTGQAAAFALAKRLKREGRKVHAHIPDGADTDWLDVLKHRSEF